MKVIDGKIVEVTEQELYGLYLERSFDLIMDFKEYRFRMEECGVVVKGAEDA